MAEWSFNEKARDKQSEATGTVSHTIIIGWIFGKSPLLTQDIENSKKENLAEKEFITINMGN